MRAPMPSLTAAWGRSFKLGIGAVPEADQRERPDQTGVGLRCWPDGQGKIKGANLTLVARTQTDRGLARINACT